MDQKKKQWEQIHKELIDVICSMGYPQEFGIVIAKGLGGEKAMRRMISYLNLAKPKSQEEIVDEMLAISGEIDSWRKKKAAEYYNGRYNELLNLGLSDEEEG